MRRDPAKLGGALMPPRIAKEEAGGMP